MSVIAAYAEYRYVALTADVQIAQRRNSLVKQIEELFLPEVQRLASETQQQHPSLRFNLWHAPVGSLTDYQGYALAVECLFPKVAQKCSRQRRVKR